MWRKKIKKMSPIKKKVNFGSILFLFLFLFLFSGFVLSQEYFVGEVFKIDLSEYGNYSVKVQTPSGVYYQESDSEVFALKIGLPGPYSIKVKGKERNRVINFEAKKKKGTSDAIIYRDIDEIGYQKINRTKKVKNIEEGKS